MTPRARNCRLFRGLIYYHERLTIIRQRSGTLGVISNVVSRAAPDPLRTLVSRNFLP